MHTAGFWKTEIKTLVQEWVMPALHSRHPLGRGRLGNPEQQSLSWTRKPLQSGKRTHIKVTQSCHCLCWGQKGGSTQSPGRGFLWRASAGRSEQLVKAIEDTWVKPHQIGMGESTQSISICLEHSRKEACDRVRTGCGRQLLVFGTHLHCLGF